MHAAYVIGTSARNSRYILQTKLKACSSSIAELYKHLEIFKNTREVQEALALGSCFSALISCFKKFPHAYITQQYTRRVFYFFIIGNVENNFFPIFLGMVSSYQTCE